MSYIRYEQSTKTYVFTGTRPNNQSTPATLDKIATRLETLIETYPEWELTELQEKFVKMVSEDEVTLKNNQIDIAHHIAISVIIDAIVKRMNNPCADDKDEDAANFVDAIITTESNTSKTKIKEFFNDLKNPSIPSDDKVKAANEAITRFNPASKNLIPGHSSSNRSISKHKDPHLVLDEEKEFIETPASIKIGEKFDAFSGIEYKPKSRVNAQGKTEYQSSSVSKDPKSSWAKLSAALPKNNENDSEKGEKFESSNLENFDEETGVPPSDIWEKSDKNDSKKEEKFESSNLEVDFDENAEVSSSDIQETYSNSHNSGSKAEDKSSDSDTECSDDSSHKYTA